MAYKIHYGVYERIGTMEELLMWNEEWQKRSKGIFGIQKINNVFDKKIRIILTECFTNDEIGRMIFEYMVIFQSVDQASKDFAYALKMARESYLIRCEIEKILNRKDSNKI